MKKQRDHLPLYGVGPVYVYVVAVCTLCAFLLRDAPLLAGGRLASVRMALAVPGFLLIISAIALWIYAVPVTKIDDGIRENRLVTTGAYALVRNPIYSSAMIASLGVVLLIGNAWFFLLIPLEWAFMTILMRATEEKWLREFYGQEYVDYCGRVNRCWPWFPKK